MKIDVGIGLIFLDVSGVHLLRFFPRATQNPTITMKPKTQAQRKIAQVRKLFEAFKESNGHAARSLAQLERWALSPEGQVALMPLCDLDGTIISDRRKFNRLQSAA